MWAQGHIDCLRFGVRDGRLPIGPAPCLMPNRRLTSAHGRRYVERSESRIMTTRAISAPGSFDPNSSKDEASSSLDDRIASGEFTEGSTKAKLLKPLREFVQTSGLPYGKDVARRMRYQEMLWEGMARRRMPEASGNLSEIVGQPVFVPLQRLYEVYGGVFRLSFGPKTFVVVSDPEVAKHVLMTNASNYNKGMLSEILKFVMGTGLIPANGDIWLRRRKKIVPALHMKYLNSMVSMFGDSSLHAMNSIQRRVDMGESIDMEKLFSQLTLDIIGKAVFNYDFDSLTRDDDIIQAVYTVLREAEHRCTAPIPYWDFPLVSLIVPQQRKVQQALVTINTTLDSLVRKCKELIEEEDLEFGEEYISQRDPSILHFLIGAGDDITSKQLRDDLMTLLIAGHETTAAVLTWTMHCLSQNPQYIPRLQEEVDRVLGDRKPQMGDFQNLPFCFQIVYEAMRLYPQPPVLLRRSLEEDSLRQYRIGPNTDIFISTYNIHRSEQHWEEASQFKPDRFPPSDRLKPDLLNSYTYLPFGAGQRKCIGDMFAMYEAVAALAILVRRFQFRMADDAPAVKMTTGATIHTEAGLWMNLYARKAAPSLPQQPPQDAAAPPADAAKPRGCPVLV
eukprot:jgi/Botrbrau1/23666/Bobra.55_2s0047.1